MAIGPGLGQNPETVGLVKRLVVENELPIVIDADGLNAYQEDVGAIPPKRPLALTPHPGEAGRLLGRAARDVQKNRLESVRKLAEQTGAFVLLKGYRTLVCDPPGNVFINLTGNPGLATGGSGDVLTGVIGALINRLPVNVALRVAAYLHGLAGDLAAAEIGQTSLIATDVIHFLPKAFRQLGAA